MNRTTHLLRNLSSNYSKLRKSSSVASPYSVFDRSAKLLQIRRAALEPDDSIYDYIRNEVGYVLADRIHDIKRDLPLILNLSCGKGHVLDHLDSSSNVGSIVATDSCEELLRRASCKEISLKKLVMDEENLKFDENSFDLVVAGLGIHWINDLPGVFRKIQYILKPDSAFIGAMFGCQTLCELRSALQIAGLEREGGISHHVSPFAQVQDIGGLLNSSGFKMLTIDTQEIKIRYPSMFELLGDLKGMGENNASWSRKLHLSRNKLFSAASIYNHLYGSDDNGGSVPATFQIIYMIAWKPQLNPSN